MTVRNERRQPILSEYMLFFLYMILVTPGPVTMFLFVIGGEDSELGSMFSGLISIFIVDPHHSEILFSFIFFLYHVLMH